MSEGPNEVTETAEPTAHELDDRDILLEVLQLALREPEKPVSEVLDLVLQLGRVDLLTEAQEMQALITEASTGVVEEGQVAP